MNKEDKKKLKELIEQNEIIIDIGEQILEDFKDDCTS